MPSIVWERDPREAYKNPYEYKAQDQFVGEAKKILNELFDELMKYSRKFERDDTSIKKAIWMLQTDSVDSLRYCLLLLKQNNHCIAGRLMRDIIETLDLSAFFSSDSGKSNKELRKWYKDKIIPHREYRDFIKKTKGDEEANRLKETYTMLSKIAHRTYRTLAYGYVLGRNNTLVYEGTTKTRLLTSPETIAMYFALLANIISITSITIKNCGLLSGSIIKNIWKDSLEKKTVPRRFV